MFDGIKILNLSVAVDALLLNERLTFPLPINEQTGAVLDRPRRSVDQGLIFTIAQRAGRLQCELKGSIHKYRNGGAHNADDFTAPDLLAVLDDLVQTFAINPFLSQLNNVEFGVNIQLSFPVKQVLNALICYKGKPFTPGPDGPIYYQCQTNQFILKMYDKGKQYGRSGHLLRFEVKVIRMQFLTSKGIHLNALADLLNIDNYPKLGRLLLQYFDDILFDDQSIKLADIPPNDRDLLRDGRNPRYWQMPDVPAGSKEYSREIKRLQRDEQRFRHILSKYRRGGVWLRQTGDGIKEKWDELTVVTPDLGTAINNKLSQWKSRFEREGEVKKCPEITGVDANDTDVEVGQGNAQNCPEITGAENGRMSRNYTKHIGLFLDNHSSNPSPPFLCPISDLDLSKQPGPRKFVSSTTLRTLFDTDRPAFDDLATRFLTPKQSGADLDKRCYYIAHNIRNQASNPRNNLRKRVERRATQRPGEPLPLFPVELLLSLTSQQRTSLHHWQGTPFESQFDGHTETPLTDQSTKS